MAFGAVLIYFGVTELLSAIQPRTERAEDRARSRLWPALGAGVAVVAIAGFGLSALGCPGATRKMARAGPVKTCNGYVELQLAGWTRWCLRARTTRCPPLTPAAGSWPTSGGRSPASCATASASSCSTPTTPSRTAREGGTDFAAEKRGENRVGAKPTPSGEGRARAAGRQPRGGQLGRRKGTRDVWLCHSVCELGATKMVDALRTSAGSSIAIPARS